MNICKNPECNKVIPNNIQFCSKDCMEKVKLETEKDKKFLLNEVMEVLKISKVKEFYHNKLEGQPQQRTIEILNNGVMFGEITTYQAICLSFITGLQFHVKFSGVR